MSGTRLSFGSKSSVPPVDCQTYSGFGVALVPDLAEQRAPARPRDAGCRASSARRCRRRARRAMPSAFGRDERRVAPAAPRPGSLSSVALRGRGGAAPPSRRAAPVTKLRSRLEERDREDRAALRLERVGLHQLQARPRAAAARGTSAETPPLASPDDHGVAAERPLERGERDVADRRRRRSAAARRRREVPVVEQRRCAVAATSAPVRPSRTWVIASPRRRAQRLERPAPGAAPVVGGCADAREHDLVVGRRARRRPSRPRPTPA